MKMNLMILVIVIMVIGFVACDGPGTTTGSEYSVGESFYGGIVYEVEDNNVNGTYDYHIIEATDSGQDTWTNAEKYASSYDDGTRSDWRLPTATELSAIYSNVSGLTSGWYWGDDVGATEDKYANALNTTNGTVGEATKENPNGYYRAVRLESSAP